MKAIEILNNIKQSQEQYWDDIDEDGHKYYKETLEAIAELQTLQARIAELEQPKTCEGCEKLLNSVACELLIVYNVNCCRQSIDYYTTKDQ